jgi:hypothetical protein
LGIQMPASDNEITEVRRVQETSDFPDDVRKASAGFSEILNWAVKNPKA